MELGKPNGLVAVEVADAMFRCRPLTTSEVNRLSEAYTKRTIKKGKQVESFDAVKFGCEVFAKTVQEWENVTRDGEPLECSEDNRRWLFEHHGDLAGDVLEGLEDAKKISRQVAQGN